MDNKSDQLWLPPGRPHPQPKSKQGAPTVGPSSILGPYPQRYDMGVATLLLPLPIPTAPWNFGQKLHLEHFHFSF